MANATSSTPILQNASDIAAGTLPRKRPVLSPVRTGLLEPASPPSPITPPAPAPPKAAGKGGAAPTTTAAAAAAAPEEAPTPLDPIILKAAEDTPEVAAFKAALTAPAPVFTKIGFTMAERVALGFLAGLKGIDAVMPVIEQRRREVSDIYQKAVEARGERLEALFKLGQLSVARQNQAREAAVQEREAKFAREKFTEEKRQFGVTAQEKAREFDLRQKELNEARDLRLQMRKEPTVTAIQEYRDTNSALGSIGKIKTLIEKGRGGQPQMTLAAIGNAPLMSLAFGNTGLVSENREIVAELANVNSIFGPGRLGANIPAGEREIIEGVLRSPGSSVGDITRALAVVERYMTPYREQLLRRYDFGPVSAPVDASGLTSTMKQEVEELVSKGYTYLYSSENGNRVYQRGGDYVEVIPDAH
jgi:hypothetical protein